MNKKQKKKDPTQKQYQEDYAAKRKADFFALFKAEAPFIRDELAQQLPAYNLFLSMEAESFSDIALRVIAKQRGIPYDPFNPPIPDCPECGLHDQVIKKGKKGYHCKMCNNGFKATHNSIVSDKRVDDLTFIRVFMAILEGYGISKTCEQCHIAPLTFYRIRNKVFYALQLFLSSVSLYGVIQADCTFVRISYKGLDLTESEFDEESIFFDKKAFIPREARKRGGSYSATVRNANSICILSLLDEHKNCANIFCGTGVASVKSLKMYIPEGKILLHVPEKNPFILSPEKEKPSSSRRKKDEQKYERAPGDASLLVIDKERALESYAKAIGLEFESHVYRSKGKQWRLSEEQHNIQEINSLHSRLKRFLRAFPVSSKFLPGYLTLFDFREMTGCSKEAISRVLEILATPGLGKPPEFYQQLFSVPNYLEQWFSGDHPLEKVPYNELLSFYLYDHIRNKDVYPGTNVTMRYIEEECGFSAKHIRAVYQNYLNAGYRDMILTYFGEVVQSRDRTAKPIKNVPPIIPVLHDEWDAYLRGEKGPRATFAKFAQEKKEQYDLPYTSRQLKYWFDRAEELGVCEPLPPEEEWVPAAPDIPQIDFELYDEWAAYLRGEKGSYASFAQFHREKVEQYGLKYSSEQLKAHFKTIESWSWREPLLLSAMEEHGDKPPKKRDVDICDEFDRLVLEQKTMGADKVNAGEIRQVLGRKYNLSAARIADCVREVHKYQRVHEGVDSIGLNQVISADEERAPRSKDEYGSMSLLRYAPFAAKRWHPIKNGSLTPDQISYGSDKKVWWLCPVCGHEWEAEVRRQARKLKCLYCEKMKHPKVDDVGLMDTHPELAAQWHPTKNGVLTPESVTTESRKVVWWMCEKGHEWRSAVSSRVNGVACPHCINKHLVQGVNDLASQFPELAAEWHPTKNGDLSPATVTAKSGRMVWWLGPCGHEWEATAQYRTKHKSGCPFCSNKKLLVGFNDLASQCAELAAQWNQVRNGTLTPEQVVTGSSKKVWWICDKGHEWEAAVYTRVKRKTGCPYCARNKHKAPDDKDALAP